MCGQVKLGSLNKKVIGAKKHIYNNITFDSKLEIACYQHLKDNNIPFEYGGFKAILFPKFRLEKVRFFQAIYSKKKLVGYGEYHTKKDEKQSFTQVTYTPDFKIEFGNYIIYIETKGNPNDVYPYKRRLFLHQCEQEIQGTDIELYFFEPRNVRQIKESINVIKELLNEQNRKDKRVLEEGTK